MALFKRKPKKEKNVGKEAGDLDMVALMFFIFLERQGGRQPAAMISKSYTLAWEYLNDERE